MIKNIFILILTGFCILGASCTSTVESPVEQVTAARQATVDAVHSLPSGYARPEVGYDTPDSARLEGWFDVSEYFSVLTHLSMQPSYTLDYIYHNIGGEDAHPFLYARKTGSKPYAALSELIQTYNDAAHWSESDHIYDYLAYVQADDSEESFFQYVVLRIMGAQFYLWWHANLNDHVIICDRAALEAVLSDFTQQDSIVKMPSEVQEKARLLELAPKVEMNKDTVSVSVVIFTKWGGFIEETYTITRTFPYTVKDIKKKTLVEWDSTIRF